MTLDIFRPVAAASLLVATASCASAAPQVPAPERYDFVGVSLDLAAGEVQRQGQQSSAFSDCSNAALHCLTSAEFELVIPRRCSDLQLGRTYGSARASSRLLWVDDSRSPHGPNRYYWFGSERNRDVVFGYTVEQGVTQIVFAPAGADLNAVATAGDLRERLTTTHDFAARGRINPEPMWRCE